MDDPQNSFSGWALLELFGHQKEVGHVETVYFGDKALFRVDVPELPEREHILTSPQYAETDPGVRSWCPAGSKVKRKAVPARSRFISPGALYAMNPCTEEAARQAMESLVSRPLILVEAPAGKTLLAADDCFTCCGASKEDGHLLSCSNYDEDEDQEGYVDEEVTRMERGI